MTPEEAFAAALAAAQTDHTIDNLVVAVSGGGDSMALLHVAQAWGRAQGKAVSALTVDHGLRDEAATEAARVAEICADFGVAHRTLDWPDWDGQGNLSAAARAARYDLIGQWAARHGLAGVALGHTADDVAETLLMRMARRAGVDGLAATATRFLRQHRFDVVEVGNHSSSDVEKTIVIDRVGNLEAARRVALVLGRL